MFKFENNSYYNMLVTPDMQHALAPNLFDPINWTPLLPLLWRCSWLLCCLPHSRFAHSAASRPDGPDLLYTPPYSALVCKKHYAAWPARHRESNHFIKMIGLVARNLVPENSPPIGLDLFGSHTPSVEPSPTIQPSLRLRTCVQLKNPIV